MGIDRALVTALPGDLYWMRGGTYKGIFSLTRAGTPTHPIVFRAFPGERATIDGTVNISGADNWLWGMETIGSVTDQPNVTMNAAGIHLINCVLRDNRTHIAIGSWQWPRQVVYGNIAYNTAYGIYGQNDYRMDGYKYVVDNIMVDMVPPGSPGSAFDKAYVAHLYSENAKVTGFYLFRNVFRGSNFAILARSPTFENVVRENYFHSTSIGIGGDATFYAPTQVEFVDNYVVDGDLKFQRFWGVSDGSGPSKPRPNVVKGNHIYRLESPYQSYVVYLNTAGYLSGAMPDRVALQGTDLFDNNTFGSGFLGALHANGRSTSSLTLLDWRTATANAGNSFDRNSIVVPLPTQNKVVLLPNEYELGRAHLVVYKWAAGATVIADLSAVVRIGSSFRIYDAKAPFGSPILTGVYTGPISLPMLNQFGVFLILSN
jgi:hypothetical protein